MGKAKYMAWMNSQQIDALIACMASELAPLRQAADGPFALIGLRTGGVWVAQRLAEKMENTQVHELDVSFYRDDFRQRGLAGNPQPSKLPLSVDGHHLVVVDDVLFTGRTVRAAINELFDRGRPRRVHLAVLIDRGGRELPIQADVVGQHVTDLKENQMLHLHGPDPLQLSLEPRS